MREKNSTFGKISENLRVSLLAKGLNQNQLADLAEISHVSISRYMTTDRVPGTEELYRMAKALDVSMEFLLTGKKDPDSEWKARAIKAEKKLASLKSIVGKLGDVTKDLTTLLND